MQPVDHAIAACVTRLAERRQARRHALVEGIERVGQDVYVDTVDRARQLCRRDEQHAHRVGVGLDLEEGSQVVVVGDGHDGDAMRPREIDHLARGTCTVGMVGMGVKVRVACHNLRDGT